jgi:hypothetical protein
MYLGRSAGNCIPALPHVDDAQPAGRPAAAALQPAALVAAEASAAQLPCLLQAKLFLLEDFGTSRAARTAPSPAHEQRESKL